MKKKKLNELVTKEVAELTESDIKYYSKEVDHGEYEILYDMRKCQKKLERMGIPFNKNFDPYLR